jgi:hypothetical protein
METWLKHEIYSVGCKIVHLHTFLDTINSVCLKSLLTQPEFQHNRYQNTVFSMMSQPHSFKIQLNIIFHRSPRFHKRFAFTFSKCLRAYILSLCILNAQSITISSEYKFTVFILMMFRYFVLTYIYIPHTHYTKINRQILIHSDLA